MFTPKFRNFSPTIKASAFSKASVEKEEKINPFGGKKPILDPDGSADQIIGIDTAGIDKLDQQEPEERTDQEGPFSGLKFKYSPEETEMPEGKSRYEYSHEEHQQSIRDRLTSHSSWRSAPTNEWGADSRLMSGGEESQENHNSEQTTNPDQEQRLEGGSVENFFKSWGKSVAYGVIGYLTDKATKAAGMEDGSAKKLVEATVNAITSAESVDSSENKDEAAFDEGATSIGTMLATEITQKAGAGLIVGTAIAGGMALRREVDKEGLRLAQNICLTLALKPSDRQNCYHWGPDGPPASRAQAQAYRDSLFANQEDPSAIAAEMWENKDPLINPGSGSTDETGNYGNYDAAGINHQRALSRYASSDGGKCFTGVTIAFSVIDRDFLTPMESAELGFLINPGRGGDNDGESAGQDQLPGSSGPSDPSDPNGGCSESI